ncbi:MAG: cytochrome c [Flavobacteriaceae bacterium]|nr:cytochrome c [Flavobacteriaceae bacterium]
MTIQKKKTLEESIADGQMIYHDFCMQCHLPSGQGVEGAFPPLAQADYLFENIDRSIASVKYGSQGSIVINSVEYPGNMTNLGLDNQEIADVMNYILHSWGNSYDQMITAEHVKSIEPRTN